VQNHFLDFVDHLQGYLGKRRSKKEAIAIATDVKFLAFCNEEYDYDQAVLFIQAVIVEVIVISCFYRILGVGGFGLCKTC